MFILGWILWGSEVTHETMDPASGLGSHRTMTLSTPCTYMKRQKTLEGLVLFGCRLGFRVHISRPLTCPSCTQIGQVLLVFFLALRWLPSPYEIVRHLRKWFKTKKTNGSDKTFKVASIIDSKRKCLCFSWGFHWLDLSGNYTWAHLSFSNILIILICFTFFFFH